MQGATIGVGVPVGDGGEAGGDIGGRVLGAQRVALFQQRGKVSGEGGLFGGGGGQHHGGEARVGADPGHLAAGFGDAVLGVEGAEVLQQCRSGGEGAGGRAVLERQLRGGGAPGGAFKHQAGEFGLQDLRAVEGRQAPMQRRRPHADGNAGGLAPGSAGTLVGGGAGDASRGQAGQPGGGVEARGAPPAAVDDDPNAGNGERGFSDRGGQDDPAGFGRSQGAVLLRWGQVAVQRQHQGAASVERGLGAADFRHPRQEGEDVALVLGQRAADGTGDGVGQIADMGDVAGLVLDGDGVLAAGAFDDLGGHQAGQAGAVGGGGHRQQPQVGTQHALEVEAKGQAEIGFQRAFVDLIEDHGGDAVQAGSDCRRRSSRPSVMTSTRVSAEPAPSRRVR